MAYSGSAYISCTTTTSSLSCCLTNLGSYEWSAGLNPNVLWTLYDSSGSEVASQRDSYSYGDTSSAGRTFTGLTAGTYILRATIYKSNDSSYYAALDDYSVIISGSGGGTGGGTTTYPTPTISVLTTQTTTNSITIRVDNMSTNQHDIYTKISTTGTAGSYTYASGGMMYFQTLSSTTMTLTGLSSNTLYYIYVEVPYNGIYTYSDTITATTSSGTIVTPTASIVIDSWTTNSVSFGLCISPVQSVDVKVGYSISDANGEEVNSDTVTIAAEKTEVSVTEDNLTPSTTYIINANAIIANKPIPAEAKSFTTLSASARPPKFEWTNPKTSGGTFNLTADEWNGLTANINAVRQYYGSALYNFTVAYKGNDFLASMFNECLYAMNSMYTNIDLTTMLVTPNSDIMAQALNDLVTLVNNL